MGNSSYTHFLYAVPSFWSGWARIVDLGDTLSEYNQSLTPAQADYLALKSDWYAVGDELAEAYREAIRGTSSPLQRMTTYSASKTEVFSGPLPPPEVLARYNDVIPQGAERILRMAEEQSKHRMALERHVVESESRRADRGLYAGVIVALAGFAASGVMAVVGQPGFATVVSALNLAALVGVFVYGTNSRKQERQQRANTLLGKPEGESPRR